MKSDIVMLQKIRLERKNLAFFDSKDWVDPFEIIEGIILNLQVTNCNLSFFGQSDIGSYQNRGYDKISLLFNYSYESGIEVWPIKKDLPSLSKVCHLISVNYRL